MTPQGVLFELLGRVGAQCGAPVLVNEHELTQWPSTAVAALKSQELLTKTRPAISAVCPGCERECMMPVFTLPDLEQPASFVCQSESLLQKLPGQTVALLVN